jgi:hypothetical protein
MSKMYMGGRMLRRKNTLKTVQQELNSAQWAVFGPAAGSRPPGVRPAPVCLDMLEVVEGYDPIPPNADKIQTDGVWIASLVEE